MMMIEVLILRRIYPIAHYWIIQFFIELLLDSIRQAFSITYESATPIKSNAGQSRCSLQGVKQPLNFHTILTEGTILPDIHKYKCLLIIGTRGQ